MFTHLSRLTDRRGLFEHAEGDTPRMAHGYCVDDVARALTVTTSESASSPALATLTETYLGFLEGAIEADGNVHNRMNGWGEWTDEASTGDWWGRAVHALGTAAVHAPLATTRRRAMRGFTLAAQRTSPNLHAMTFAAIGAAEVLAAGPRLGISSPLGSARRIITRAAALICAAPKGTSWPWPEARLRYSSGSLPEALIAGGHALDDRVMTARGLAMLGFLLDLETMDGQLSVTGTQGKGEGESGPQFDQQPIEVAALASACARAYDVTGDSRWLDGLRLAWDWFLGVNDSETPMIDLATGAGFDGLMPEGRNDNRGAESTLAALSTFQLARRLLGAPALSAVTLPGTLVSMPSARGGRA